MSCPRCGHDLPDAATACGRCGAHHPSAPWAPAWREPAPATGAAGRAGWIVATVLALVLMLASATVGALLVREPMPGSGSSTPATELAADGSGSSDVGAPTLDRDFSQVYADVSDGIGKVVVVSCSGESLTGSAFLVDEGVMLTAGHVVKDATDVRVELDRAVVGASVEAVDAIHDLALLRLEASVPGHVFDFSSSAPRTGVPVAAIGYPLGEAKTLTVGTISGLDRDISTETGDYVGLLQTDTAINPGSSGGPLLDASGQVVAVADAMRTDARGIGFGVPAATAATLTDGDGSTDSPDGCR